jgi:hypothetical protein
MSTTIAAGRTERIDDRSHQADEPPEPDRARDGAAPAEAAPALPIGGPRPSSWREHSFTRIAELATVARWLRPRSTDPSAAEILASIMRHLAAARDAAERSSSLRSVTAGAAVERTMSNLAAAEADLLRLAPLDYVRGQLPSILAHVRAHLPASDPRRAQAEKIATGNALLEEYDRERLIAAVRSASSESRRENMRVRSFRNVLLIASGILALIAIALAVLGATKPDVLPLCFEPGNEQVVCPSQQNPISGDVDEVIGNTVKGWDLPLVLLIGMTAGAVAAAAALRGVRGTSTPYSLPVTLAVLKLPTGALTAVLGLLLMRGQFVPGLSALDSGAQIIAWAIVFGYAQQLLTRFVDRQAHSVLDSVGSATRSRS